MNHIHFPERLQNQSNEFVLLGISIHLQKCKEITLYVAIEVGKSYKVYRHYCYYVSTQTTLEAVKYGTIVKDEKLCKGLFPHIKLPFSY